MADVVVIGIDPECDEHKPAEARVVKVFGDAEATKFVKQFAPAKFFFEEA